MKKRRKSRYKNFRSRVRTQDSVSPSGAGSCQDRGRGYEPYGLWDEGFGSWDRNNRQHRGSGRYYYDFLFYRLWREYWEAKKIVNIPAGDMTREGWTYESADLEPEQIELIEKEADRLKVVQTVHWALLLERLYGGSAIVLGTQELEGNSEEPLQIDQIGKGDLAFIRAIPRSLLSPTKIEADPLSQDYLNPRKYMIYNSRVDRSRLLIFDGGGNPAQDVKAVGYYDRNRLDGFGDSVLHRLAKDIYRADGTRQAAFHLLHLSSLMLFKRNTGGGLMQGATRKGAKNIERLEDILKEISIYRGTILDGEDDIAQRNVGVGGLSELMVAFLQVLSAASDIPAPRFLGEAPGGLNATGKGDLVNYYDHIKSEQVLRLMPQLQRLMPLLTASALGKPVPVTIKFKPLLQLSEEQQVSLRTQDLGNITQALTLGLGTDEWAAKEAMEREIFLNDPVENGGLGSGIELPNGQDFSDTPFRNEPQA